MLLGSTSATQSSRVNHIGKGAIYKAAKKGICTRQVKRFIWPRKRFIWIGGVIGRFPPLILSVVRAIGVEGGIAICIARAAS